MKLQTEVIKTGIKIGGAILGGIMVIGSQEAILDSLRKEKNKINKARAQQEFNNPFVIETKTLVIEKESIKAMLKEQAANIVKETVNIAQLGVARSAEHFVREEQQQLLKKQSGNIYRHIEEIKNK